ncbi:MAG: subclass B1 metallo-beta-lactamase [Bacteroidetes bacterium]|nr:subclass B1 metallo-beta-lactamase [Bacteroidota bacterium]
MFDTPWDTAQFQPLLDNIEMRHNKIVLLCFATHWHSDKTIGLAYSREKGIKTYTTVLNDELSNLNNKKRAEFLMTKDTNFTTGQYSFETGYLREAHNRDNIVIWFEKERILYTGYLIKGTDVDDLSFIGDGNKKTYAGTLKKVQKKFRHPSWIVITNSDWKDIGSLKHSIRMANKLGRNN